MGRSICVIFSFYCTNCIFYHTITPYMKLSESWNVCAADTTVWGSIPAAGDLNPVPSVSNPWSCSSASSLVRSSCQPDPIISPTSYCKAHYTEIMLLCHEIRLQTAHQSLTCSAFQCSARKTSHNTVEGNKGSSITRHKAQLHPPEWQRCSTCVTKGQEWPMFIVKDLTLISLIMCVDHHLYLWIWQMPLSKRCIVHAGYTFNID